MKSSNPIVFIVDDDASVRRALERLIRSAGFDAESFPSAQNFLCSARHDRPACVVLDIQMPGITGLELQEQLGGAGLNMPIVFVTGHGSVPVSVRAMKAGALDFLEKPFDEQDLLDTVRRAIDRDTEARLSQAEVSEIQQRIGSMTPREREVFARVISGMLNKQIAAELGTTEKTIKVHRSRVMEKMQVRSVAELVHLAEKVELKIPQR